MDYRNKEKELQRDIIKMIYEAGSGHAGGSLSVLDILMALYYDVMRVDPQNPDWAERDRLVLSKGHACPALYAILADKGYFSREELWTLRKLGSRLQGHPDTNKTPGVDCSTGSLGQGASIAAGMAMGAKHLKKDYHVYAVIGDGESQEGIIWEMAMSAAQFKLDNFTVILDHNGLQIDGSNDDVMGIGDICGKFEASGWNVVRVKDGHDFDALRGALVQRCEGKPTFICCETVKGHGVSFMENDYGWHGKTIDTPTYEAAMKELGGR